MSLESSKKYGSWSGGEIEEFLAETRVPLRMSFVTKAGLLIVPIWFKYQANCFWFCSPNDSLLVKAIREKPEVAFDVSTNDIPYQGVRGRGVAHCSVAPDKSALEELLNRYVAGTDSDLAQWLLSRSGSEAVIQIEVTWLTSWDFSGRMKSIEKISTRLPDQTL